ncbi:hypothetical protein yc1106_05921 [Curvularia clavata]|uniref:Uncharacterized protein n=1 Tax=Curvularia clavata TaxID=95742 RepID=A0A9Q8ZAN8_CURCL|nr:hypothetical protein yc1106_05921 [Curvularia clavata]
MQPDSYTTIEGWLATIDVTVLSATAPASGLVLQVNAGGLPPDTPRQNPSQIYEEISPTDTSFSADTIFDTPVDKPPHFNYGPSSDCGSQDAYSDNTTLQSEYDKEAVEEEQNASDYAITLDKAITPDDAVTLSTDTGDTSCSPLGTTTSSQICEHEARGEDEGLWKKKMELREEMGQEWVAEQDRKNWVLPNPLGEASGWQKRGIWVHEGKGYPGEGEGRIVLRELVVVLED